MAKHTGLYLLSAVIIILAESAQPFVLLTANMKDIKKIASSFVSDALADKITEFVMKATEQISEQNKDSANKIFDNVLSSREYKLPNNGRQREENPRNSEIYNKYISNKDDRNKGSYKIDKDSLDNKDSFIKGKYNYKVDFENKDESGDRFDHEQKKWHKEIIEIDSNERPDNTFGSKNKNDWTDRLESLKSNENTRRPSRFSKTERKHEKNKDLTRVRNEISSEESPKFKFDDDYERDTQRPEKESNIFQYYDKESSSRPKPKIDKTEARSDERVYKNKEQGYSKTETTFPRYESKAFKNIHKGRSNERLHRDRFKTVVNSAESRDKINDNKYYKQNIYRSADLTTKKERIDIDQYDNKNYPKAEFVATSGNLMLPKVYVHKKEGNQENYEKENEKAWWEKEMPNPVKTISWSA